MTRSLTQLFSGGSDAWRRAFNGNDQDRRATDPVSSIWLYSGLEGKSRALASLDMAFVDSNDSALVRMNKEQEAMKRLLERPDSMITGSQLWELTTMHYELDGVAYWVLYNDAEPIGSPFEVPTSILCFGSNHVKPRSVGGRFVGYTFNLGDKYYNLEFYQVLRFWKTNPYSYVEGLDMSTRGFDTIELESAAKRTNKNFFKHGARLSGTLRHVGRESYEEARRQAQEFKDQAISPENSGKLMFVPKSFEYSESSGIKDMDFQKLHRNNRDEFFALSGTPKHHLGVNDDLNYATAEITERVYYENKILPMAKVFSEIVNSNLLAGTGMFIKFTFDKHPSIQMGLLKVEEQKSRVMDNLWRVATRMYNMGYPQNVINSYLDIDLTLKAKFANKPNDPQSSVQVETNVRSFGVYDGALDFLTKRMGEGKKSIDEAVASGDKEAMAAFCEDVEKKSIGDKIKPFENKIASYFNRLESAQVKRLAATLKASEEKSNLKEDITESNIEDSLFNLEKWSLALILDTKSMYLSAYKSSLNVIETEIDGFESFSMTEDEIISRASEIQSNVVGINERLRSNLRDLIADGVAAGLMMEAIIDSVRDEFEMARVRKTTIAITELGFVMNTARFDVIKAEFSEKIWVDSNDSLVRVSHGINSSLGARKMNFEYAPGLKYPQDPNCNIASEVVNCRCKLIGRSRR